jgi:FkbH-like protein
MSSVIANHFPESLLSKLSKVVAAVESAESGDFEWKEELHIHVLRNFTIEPLEPWLKFHLMRQSIWPRLTFGGYDSMAQEILDPASSINETHPDVILIALVSDPIESNLRVSESEEEQLLLGISRLLDLTDALIVVNSLVPPIEDLLESRHGGSNRLVALSRELEDMADCQPRRLVVIPWEDYLGDPAKSLDRRFWRSSQAPFRSAFLNRYAQDVSAALRMRRGPAKKCLFLDCDNTLWGGVVGEDGIAGLELNPEQEPGVFFYRFHKAVIELVERGIMVALVSKNNEADVLEVLDNHPDCLLKRKHLIAWRINWSDKASNIRDLVRELNIGMDSVVFVDDSPQECELVRQLLPEVVVLPVPNQLQDYGRMLDRSGLFERHANSDEDRRRTKMYQDESRRKQSQTAYSDLADYLRSLDTVATVRKMNATDHERVAQLTQKTNQFNLTTRRYSVKDVAAIAQAESCAVFVISVKDRFGDLGTVGVLIVKKEENSAIVDTLLLSCRALSRKIEYAFVDQAMNLVERDWQIDTWFAEYIPSRKNSQASEFWDALGFELISEDQQGKHYRAPLCRRPQSYLEVITVRLEDASGRKS